MQQDYLHDLSQELRILDNTRPHYNEGDLERLTTMKNEIQTFLENIFSRFPDLESPVGDFFKGPLLESTLLEGKHFSLMREN